MTQNGLLQRVGALDERHPLWWDVVPALLIATIAVRATPSDLGPVGVALLLVVHGALVLRRRKPLPALLTALAGVVVGAALTLLTEMAMPWPYLALWLLLFNLGLRERVLPLWVISVLIGLTAATALVGVDDSDLLRVDERLRSALAVLSMCAASYLLGLQIQTRRAQAVARRAEAARTAVVAERLRIAQEMHDIIGHNLSVITSLANGGAVAARTSPQEAARAFDAIGSVSRSSVREVRRVLMVLRQDHTAEGASLAPPPGLADVPVLIDSVRGTGVDVHLERTGDLRGLSVGRQLAIYRIVQESLTNVLRHAGARAQVDVRIAQQHDELAVSVEDTGSSPVESQEPAGGTPGQGIIGMQERAEAYGGSLTACATPTGWAVRARIPVDQQEATMTRRQK